MCVNSPPSSSCGIRFQLNAHLVYMSVNVHPAKSAREEDRHPNFRLRILRKFENAKRRLEGKVGMVVLWQLGASLSPFKEWVDVPSPAAGYPDPIACPFQANIENAPLAKRFSSRSGRVSLSARGHLHWPSPLAPHLHLHLPFAGPIEATAQQRRSLCLRTRWTGGPQPS